MPYGLRKLPPWLALGSSRLLTLVVRGVVTTWPTVLAAEFVAACRCGGFTTQLAILFLDSCHDTRPCGPGASVALEPHDEQQ